MGGKEKTMKRRIRVEITEEGVKLVFPSVMERKEFAKEFDQILRPETHYFCKVEDAREYLLRTTKVGMPDGFLPARNEEIGAMITILQKQGYVTKLNS